MCNDTLTGQLYDEDVQVGMTIPTLEKRPDLQQLVMYASASEDYHEIHYDQDFARKQGFPKPIVQGALKSGFLAQLITDWVGDGGRLWKLEIQYRKPDFHGEPMYCMGKVISKYVDGDHYLVECDVWIENSSGEKTVFGTAIVGIPPKTS
tara:strand:- start:4382 stop:4831 length:450 start_codon:yes stop_codon:yes gene_type:complete